MAEKGAASAKKGVSGASEAFRSRADTICCRCRRESEKVNQRPVEMFICFKLHAVWPSEALLVVVEGRHTTLNDGRYRSKSVPWPSAALERKYNRGVFPPPLSIDRRLPRTR